MTTEAETRGCGYYLREIREILEYSRLAFFLFFGDGTLPEDLPPPPQNPPSRPDLIHPSPQPS